MAELTWYPVDKQNISGVVLGEARLKGLGVRSPRSLLSRENPVAVGFAPPRNTPLNYQIPALILVDETQAAELFSWLRVYDRPTFPLSQYSRVIGVDDLYLLDEGIDDNDSRSDAWACVVLGEVLAQGEYTDAKLSAIPLSHAGGSFSHVVARTALLHGKGRAVEVCIRRLAVLEADPSLGRKPMTTRDLELIWTFLEVDLGVLQSDNDLFLFVDQTLQALSRNGGSRVPWESLKRSLASDSVEERVLAFNSLLSEVARRFDRHEVTEMEAGLYVASAAFFAGRGTGHYFLLRRAGPISAAASLWFGLLAGLRGSHAWDVEWMRAVKGIERHLRQRIVWGDPPLSDLGWLEYSWLSKAVSGPALLLGVARQSARALAVEVLPGVVCQMRTAQVDMKQEPQLTASSVIERELRVALEQFLDLSEKTKKLLGKNFSSPVAEPAQRSGAALEAQKFLFGSDKPNKPKRSQKKSDKYKDK